MIWLKRWIVNLGLMVFSIILMALLLELILRSIGYDFLLTLPKPNLAEEYHKPDKEAGYDVKENCKREIMKAKNKGDYIYEIWSNELGCFDRPYNGEKDYILLVGDSFAFGFAPFEDIWGTVMEQVCGHRVLKCGVIGYGTRQELIKANKIISKIKSSPKLIVVGYHLNDLKDDYLFPSAAEEGEGPSIKRKVKLLTDYKTGEWEERILRDDEDSDSYRYRTGSFIQKTTCWLSHNSVLYNLIKISIKNTLLKRKPWEYSYPELCFYPPEEYPWIKKAWEGHLENLKAFKRLADEHNANLLIVIIPSNYQVYPFLSNDKKIDIEQPNRILKEFFETENIQFIDLLPPFRKNACQRPKKWLDSKKDLYWRMDRHLNVRGNHLAGLLVSEYIIEHNLIDIKNRDEKLKVVREELKKYKN